MARCSKTAAVIVALIAVTTFAVVITPLADWRRDLWTAAVAAAWFAAGRASARRRDA